MELNSSRKILSGSDTALSKAIQQGADLRVYTEFRHNEHVDVTSDNPELVRETIDFRLTYLIDKQWTAGISTLRQPIALPNAFGPRPSMSFFMYNQDGSQAIARPYLDGGQLNRKPAWSGLDDHSQIPKYHRLDIWDEDTNAPSSNFIYEFDVYRWWVRDDWKEVLSHTAEGRIVSGSVDKLAEMFACGCEVKVGIQGLCADMGSDRSDVIEHEVFVHIGSCYYYTEQKLFIGASHPLVRIRPGVPLRYTGKGWDFGWLMLRTDGFVARLLCDPYTLRFNRSGGRYAMQWFVR
jgi:hypothetical protein